MSYFPYFFRAKKFQKTEKYRPETTSFNTETSNIRELYDCAIVREPSLSLPGVLHQII